jgi:glycosyltransferase involved in cell wall biosynthesis
MKLGIIIATYQRIDGKTPELLKRAISSIQYQKYQNYQLIIVGDRYDDAEEFERICTENAISDKIIHINLDHAAEREKYPIGSKELWNSGGVNARNTGIEMALEMGLTYICHLDHDDYWTPDHLSNITSVIEQDPNAAFIYACSTYIDRYIPYIPITGAVYRISPQPCNLVHSSVCINHKTIPLRYRDVYAEEQRIEPADADLWSRISSHIHVHNLNSYLIAAITCHHPTENQ